MFHTDFFSVREIFGQLLADCPQFEPAVDWQMVEFCKRNGLSYERQSQIYVMRKLKIRAKAANAAVIVVGMKDELTRTARTIGKITNLFIQLLE